MKTQDNPPVVSKKMLVPFVLITSLFALWGFANDITNPMVSAFKKLLELNNTQASWVQAAFYGGYFTMALPAAFVVKKYTYKIGILVGLGLYAIGALLFYPAAAMENYLFFLLALYILTFGLAFLETTANPYILAKGAEKTATQRLNLAQAFNPLGALSGLFVAQIMCWTYIYQYAENLGISNQDAVNYAYAALVIFLASRFLCTYLMKFIPSGKLLMLLAALVIVFCSGTIFILDMGGLYSLVMVSFCMSLMFPTIYGIALTGLGDDAKPASAFLVMAIVGGAFMPVLQGLVLDIGGSAYGDVRILGVPEVNFSFIFPLVCFVVVAGYGFRARKVYEIDT